MSSVPTQYPTRNSLRRQSKTQRNPWKASSSVSQEVSGYSGNSDTLSSGSRKYRSSTRKVTSSTVGPQQREIICHQPEPAYENVAANRQMMLATLSRYVNTQPQIQQVPTQTVHKFPGSTSLYTLQANSHHVHAPLIDASRPSTSPEVQNIYDVIEEKSSGRRTGTSRGTMPHRPMTPGSVKTVASETGVYACGGNCLTFETVCDKILRILYGIGVFVGVGLLIIGMNVNQIRNHQNTMMYIGLMVFSVCCFLLYIQCHHYSNRRRRRTIIVRRPVIPTNHIPLGQETIPLQDFNLNGIPIVHTNLSHHNQQHLHHLPGTSNGNNHVLLHENPLLHRYIEQQSTYTPSELETHAATSSLYAQA